MQKITPMLWFDNQAEEAAEFYTSIFPNSRIVSISRYGEAGFETHGRPAGSVMVVEFELDGQRFTALNGGPQFKFTEAISLVVNCADQDEVDRMWARLCDGGEEGPCGWLKDRYGLSWQVIPARAVELLSDPDRGKSDAVMSAIMGMKKIEIEALERAYRAARTGIRDSTMKSETPANLETPPCDS